VKNTDDAASKELVVTFVAKSRDRIAEGLLLMLMETNKTDAKMPSPMMGEVLTAQAAEGDKVAAGVFTSAVEG
jgi:biotin carboxyl carrier protein